MATWFAEEGLRSLSWGSRQCLFFSCTVPPHTEPETLVPGMQGEHFLVYDIKREIMMWKMKRLRKSNQFGALTLSQDIILHTFSWTSYETRWFSKIAPRGSYLFNLYSYMCSHFSLQNGVVIMEGISPLHPTIHFHCLKVIILFLLFVSNDCQLLTPEHFTASLQWENR